jgi:hypothetical protein
MAGPPNTRGLSPASKPIKKFSSNEETKSSESCQNRELIFVSARVQAFPDEDTLSQRGGWGHCLKTSHRSVCSGSFLTDKEGMKKAKNVQQLVFDPFFFPTTTEHHRNTVANGSSTDGRSRI